MSKKILVPLDGSPFAEAALPCVQELAKNENAEIVILRVPIVPAREFFRRDAAMAFKISREVDGESEQYVQAEVKKLEKEGTPTTGMIREGPVPETIIKVADEIHANMIAMATHGRTGFQLLLKGSVADEIVHLTHIPVMLIHPN